VTPDAAEGLDGLLWVGAGPHRSRVPSSPLVSAGCRPTPQHRRRGEVCGGARQVANRPRPGLVAADAAHGFVHPTFDAGLPLLADQARDDWCGSADFGFDAAAENPPSGGAAILCGGIATKHLPSSTNAPHHRLPSCEKLAMFSTPRSTVSVRPNSFGERYSILRPSKITCVLPSI